MSATLKQEGELWVVKLTGILQKSELDAIHQEAAEKLALETKAKVLIIAEDFLDWQKGDAWGDVGFVSNYGDRIEKIAILAGSEWEDRMLMFTGAGLRSTQIRFFPAGQLANAQMWLTE